MSAQKISKRDPELERGEKSAYNLCDVLDRTAATSTWMWVNIKGLDYVVSARLEVSGKPVGGPPLIEMATRKSQVQEATRWAREVARHLARMEASATFWLFAADPKPSRMSPAYVVQVEAVPAGSGVNGHSALMAELRVTAARADRAAKRSERPRKPRR